MEVTNTSIGKSRWLLTSEIWETIKLGQVLRWKLLDSDSLWLGKIKIGLCPNFPIIATFWLLTEVDKANQRTTLRGSGTTTKTTKSLALTARRKAWPADSSIYIYIYIYI